MRVGGGLTAQAGTSVNLPWAAAEAAKASR